MLRLQWRKRHVQARFAPDQLPELAEHCMAAFRVLCYACVHLWISHVLLGWTAASATGGDEAGTIVLLRCRIYTKASWKRTMEPCKGTR